MQNKRFSWLLLGIMAVLVGAGLVLLARTGLAARPLADDYCYDSLLGSKGFWGGQVYSYFGNDVPYAGNRYSLTLGMALSGLFGPLVAMILPGLAIILWVGGVFWAFRQAARLVVGVLPPETLLGMGVSAAALVFFTLYLAPNRIQVLYWRPGMFPYLAPLATQAWLAAAGFGTVRSAAGSRPRFFILRLVGILGLAFLAAGFSETAATLQVGLLGAGLLAALLLSGKRLPGSRAAIWTAAAALLGTALAGLVLISAPMNQARLAASYGASNSLPAALALTLDSTRTFIQLTLYRSTVPYLFSGLFFMVLGVVGKAISSAPSGARNQAQTGEGRVGRLIAEAAGGVVLVGGLGLGLIYGSMFPGAYAESSYPGDRALIVTRYISLLVSGGAGMILGRLFWELARRWKWGFILPGSLAGALAGIWVWILLWLPPGPAGEPAFPDLRAVLQSGPGLLGFAAAMGGGLLLGSLLEFWSGRGRPGGLVSPVACLLVSIFLASQLGYAGARIYQEVQPLDRRALLWDRRDAQIRQLAAQGEKIVTVPALDSLAGIFELQDNPGHWVNHCAAGYYGLESLRAVEPVLR